MRALPLYVAAAGEVCGWRCFEPGVHATVAGVALGLLTPAWPFQPPEAVAADARDRLDAVISRRADGVADEDEQTTLLHIGALVGEAVSPLERLERTLHPWASYLVLPSGIGFTVSLFIAGLAFPPGDLDDAARLGILIASLLAGASGAVLLGRTPARGP